MQAIELYEKEIIRDMTEMYFIGGDQHSKKAISETPIIA